MKKGSLAFASPKTRCIIFFVPLDGEFGDWATPKESTAGHFFLRRHFRRNPYKKL
jgi:hypothetical protein